jgi:hypothetical protein
VSRRRRARSTTSAVTGATFGKSRRVRSSTCRASSHLPGLHDVLGRPVRHRPGDLQAGDAVRQHAKDTEPTNDSTLSPSMWWISSPGFSPESGRSRWWARPMTTRTDPKRDQSHAARARVCALTGPAAANVARRASRPSHVCMLQGPHPCNQTWGGFRACTCARSRRCRAGPSLFGGPARPRAWVPVRWFQATLQGRSPVTEASTSAAGTSAA